MTSHGLWKTRCRLRESTVAVTLCTLLAPGLAHGRSTPRCAGARGPLVADTAVHQTPDLPEPAARVPYRDSFFGTCQMRVTDRLLDRSGRVVWPSASVVDNSTGDPTIIPAILSAR